MGATSRYGWNYPEIGDPPNTAAHLRALAEAVEATLGVVDDKVNAAPIGGEWRASATQNLVTGVNKLQVPTVVRPPNGITFNGTDTWTVITPGVYSLWGQLRSNALVNGGIAFGAPVYADGTHILPFNSFSGGNDYGNGGGVYLAAEQQFCAYFYNNNGATSTNHGLRPAQVKIWKVA